MKNRWVLVLSFALLVFGPRVAYSQIVVPLAVEIGANSAANCDAPATKIVPADINSSRGEITLTANCAVYVAREQEVRLLVRGKLEPGQFKVTYVALDGRESALQHSAYLTDAEYNRFPLKSVEGAPIITKAIQQESFYKVAKRLLVGESFQVVFGFDASVGRIVPPLIVRLPFLSEVSTNVRVSNTRVRAIDFDNIGLK